MKVLDIEPAIPSVQIHFNSQGYTYSSQLPKSNISKSSHVFAATYTNLVWSDGESSLMFNFLHKIIAVVANSLYARQISLQRS